MKVLEPMMAEPLPLEFLPDGVRHIMEEIEGRRKDRTFVTHHNSAGLSGASGSDSGIGSQRVVDGSSNVEEAALLAR